MSSDIETSSGVEHVPTIPLPKDQRDIISQQLRTYASMKDGDDRYLISCKWWRSYKSYISLDTTYFRESDAEAPGPITNAELLTDKNELKASLIDVRDYVLVPTMVWKILCKWFGGVEIKRQCVRPMKGQQLICEVYPFAISFVLNNAEGGLVLQRDFEVSRAEPLSKLKFLSKFLFNIPHEECSDQPEIDPLSCDLPLIKLYVYIHDESIISLDHDDTSTMTECGVMPGDTIIITTKTMSKLAKSKATSSFSQTTSVKVKNILDSDSDDDVVVDKQQKQKQQKIGIRGFVGLGNLGNTCFMNSGLQCLSNLHPLRDYFVTGEYRYEINANNPLGTEGSLARSFGKLMRQIWSYPTSNSVSPRDFKQCLGRSAEQFAGMDQHDSQELVACILDKLHEDCNRVIEKPYTADRKKTDVDDGADEAEVDARLSKVCWDIHLERNKSVIVDWFQGLLKNVVTCPKCQKTSKTFDPLMFLSLPLSKADSSDRTIGLVCRNGSLPRKFNVQISKFARIQELAAKTCEMFPEWHMDPNCLIAVDFYRGSFFGYLDSNITLDRLNNNVDIYFFDITSDVQSSSVENKNDIDKDKDEEDLSKAVEGIMHFIYQRENVRRWAMNASENYDDLIRIVEEGKQTLVKMNNSTDDYHIRTLCMQTRFFDRIANPSDVATFQSVLEPFSRFVNRAYVPDRFGQISFSRTEVKEVTDWYGRTHIRTESHAVAFPMLINWDVETNPETGIDVLVPIFDQLKLKLLPVVEAAAVTDETDAPQVNERVEMPTAPGKACLLRFMSNAMKKMCRFFLASTDKEIIEGDVMSEYGNWHKKFVEHKGDKAGEELTLMLKYIELLKEALHVPRMTEKKRIQMFNIFARQEVFQEKISRNASNSENILYHPSYLTNDECTQNFYKIFEEYHKDSDGKQEVVKTEEESDKFLQDCFDACPLNEEDVASLVTEFGLYKKGDKINLRFNECWAMISLDAEESERLSDFVEHEKAMRAMYDAFILSENPPVVVSDQEADEDKNKGPNLPPVESEWPVPISSQSPTVYTLLEKCYLQREVLEETELWKCEPCNERVPSAIKQFYLWDLPRILIIHLKRFSMAGNWLDKDDAFVNFPTKGLDLRKYEMRHADHPENSLAVYDLVGISNHFGGMGGGHYTAFCLNQVTDRWIEFDDSYASYVNNIDKIVSSSAYMLFYIRRDVYSAGQGSWSERLPSLLPSAANHKPSQSSDGEDGDAADARIPAVDSGLDSLDDDDTRNYMFEKAKKNMKPVSSSSSSSFAPHSNFSSVGSMWSSSGVNGNDSDDDWKNAVGNSSSAPSASVAESKGSAEDEERQHLLTATVMDEEEIKRKQQQDEIKSNQKEMSGVSGQMAFAMARLERKETDDDDYT